MRHTENLGLSLYDSEDKMNITGETESLNHNMQLLDAAIWDNKQNAIFTQSARIALLNCFEKVAWSDESGRELCEVLRQELLINDSLNEYVVDGLELWFDGEKNTRIGHSSVLSVWEDLSGNNHDMRCVGNTTATSVKTAQCGYNYVVFDGSTMFYNNDNIASLRTFNNGTLEIVFEQETSDTSQSIITTYTSTGTGTTTQKPGIKNKGIWYRPASNGYRINTIDKGDISSGFIMDVPTEKIAFSVSYVGDVYNVTVNGNTISDFTEGGTMPCNKTFAVGAKAWAEGDLYGFFGKIYTIRYYNRVLTSDEIAQNLSVDRKRFNF